MPNGIIADAHLNPERNMKSLFNMKYLATVIFAFVTVGFLAFVAFYWCWFNIKYIGGVYFTLALMPSCFPEIHLVIDLTMRNGVLADEEYDVGVFNAFCLV